MKEHDRIAISMVSYLLLGFILGITMGWALFSGTYSDGDTKDLGNTICDQEYNMDFDSYDDKELKCKPKEIKAEKQYDGITVQIR